MVDCVGEYTYDQPNVRADCCFYEREERENTNRCWAARKPKARPVSAPLIPPPTRPVIGATPIPAVASMVESKGSTISAWHAVCQLLRRGGLTIGASTANRMSRTDAATTYKTLSRNPAQ
jgi:hypothetical protein